MIVEEVMNTKLVMVEAGDSLGHAVSLLRHHQIHHLPVVQFLPREAPDEERWQFRPPIPILQGLISTKDVEQAMAIGQEEQRQNALARSWQERLVGEITQQTRWCVTPDTALGAAAHILLERGINCLPVIAPEQEGEKTRDVLVGIITRSDLLLALIRYMGSDEPGTDVVISLPDGHFTFLARALSLIDELHIPLHRLVLTPFDPLRPRAAQLRLGTIHPAPFLRRLKQEGIASSLGFPSAEEIAPRS